MAVTAVSGRGPPCELIMFQKKQYHTKQERRRDRIAGIVFVIAFNVIAFLSTGLLQGYAISPRVVDPITGERPPFLETLLIIAMILPWVINLLIVLYGLRFRHEFAVGFLTVLGIGMIVPALLSMLFVPACLVAMLVSTPFWLLGPLVGGIVFGLLLAFCMIYPIYRLGLAIQPSLASWWAYPEDNEELPREKGWVPAPDVTWENDVPEGTGGDDEVA